MKPSRLQDDGVCLLCDWWWLILLLLLLILAAILTKPYWGPAIFPPTPTPLPTATMIPTITLPATVTPTPTLEPTRTSTAVPGTGDVQVTLFWDGRNDLDLHVVDPAGEEIFYGYSSSTSGGKLDIDGNAGCGSNMTDSPIENVFWATGGAPRGNFRIFVNYYSQCTNTLPTRFRVRLLVDGKIQEFEGIVERTGQDVPVTEFTR